MDEVQTGYGRTGRFWGHEHSAARPDVLITAKGLASGFPCRRSRRHRADGEGVARFPGRHLRRQRGRAAALATLQVIQDEDLVGNSARQGARLNDGLRKVAADHPEIGDVRGLGLMQASEFTTSEGEPDAAAAQQHKAAAEHGLLLLTCGAHGNVVRMIPPLIVTEAQIDDALDLWSRSVTDAVG